jgi:hypothetical protein
VLTAGQRLEPSPTLAAETGVAAFRVAVARWITDASGDLSLGEHIAEAASALRALAGGQSSALCSNIGALENGQDSSIDKSRCRTYAAGRTWELTLPRPRRSGVTAEHFDSAGSGFAAVDTRVGSDQRNAQGLSQGHILCLVGGQIGVEDLDA